MQERRSLPCVHHLAEQVSGTVNIVGGVMSASIVKTDACAPTGFAEHSVAVSYGRQGRGIQGGKRVERVSLDTGSHAR